MISIKSQKGVFSIEFSLGVLLLFISLFMVFELCRFIYIINLTESSLRESSRDTRLYEGKRVNNHYQTRFLQIFNKKGQVWHTIIEPKRFDLTINYYRSYAALIDNKVTLNCADCPVAEYKLTYRYEPVLHLPGVENRLLTHSILVVQEHEGWNP